MIYRLNTNTRLIGFYYVGPVVPAGIASSSFYDYQAVFEETYLSSDRSLCRMFKAPLLPEWRINVNLGVKSRGRQEDLPDIFSLIDSILVSEKVKKIIEMEDGFRHQYWPVSLLDDGGNRISSVQYYRMNMRRYLKIEPSTGEISGLDFSLDDAFGESGFISTILGNKSLRSIIQDLPLWKAVNGMSVSGALYIGPGLMAALKSAGVKGVREYSVKDGRAGEYVSHV